MKYLNRQSLLSCLSVTSLCLCVSVVKPLHTLAQDKPPVPAAPVVAPPVIDHALAAITSLAYSPDGKRLALGTFGQVIVYDATSWQPLAITHEIEDSARSLAFSPDGQALAIGCGLPGVDGLALTWDMGMNSKPVAYPKQKDVIEAVAFRRDGKGLLCGADDNKVRYISNLPAPMGQVLDEHNGRVQAAAFSPKPDYVFITGGLDRIVKVWDQKTMHTVINFDQSEGGVTGLAFINENQFVGSSLDGKLYWWGIGYDAKKQTYSGYHFRTTGAHDGGVLSLSISNDGKRLITTGIDKSVIVWRTDAGKVREWKDLAQPMYVAALNPDGKTAAMGGRDGILYVYDVDGGKLLNNFVPPAFPNRLQMRKQVTQRQTNSQKKQVNRSETNRAMPARDLFHEKLKTALLKDGWTITADPLSIKLTRQTVFIDLGAERPLAAEKAGRKIAVEIKGFNAFSPIYALQRALGQYLFYRYLVQQRQPERVVWLALPEQALGLF